MNFFDLINSIINETSFCSIYTNKCQNICTTLKTNLEEIKEYLKSSEINPEQISKLTKILSPLLDMVINLKDQQFFWKYLQSNIRFDKFFKEIDEIMNSFYLELKAIGIPNPSKLTDECFYQDYWQINDFLENALNIIQRRKTEISFYLTQNPQIISDLNGKPLDDYIKAELIRLNKLLDKDDYDLQGKQSCGENDLFKYYRTRKISTNESFFLLEMLDKTRFNRFLTVSTAIEHDNVEKFYGAFFDDDKLYIVTNREGESLFNVLHSSNPSKRTVFLGPSDLTKVAYQVSQGLSYLHSHNVMHRNIGPHYVYVSRLPNGDIKAQVVGLCSSRQIGSIDSLFNSTRNECKVDSCECFVDPDFESDFTYDEKIDVYAFGGLLYSLATGELPNSKNDLKKSISTIPGKLQELIKSCVQKDTSKRPSFEKITQEFCEGAVFAQDAEASKALNFLTNTAEKSKNAQSIIEQIEVLKVNLTNAFQYRFELIQIRSVFNSYQHFLVSEYLHKQLLAEEETALKELSILLSELSRQTENAQLDKFKHSVEKVIITDITENLTDLMDRIHKLMLQLNFDDNNGRIKYIEQKENVILDYHQLEIYFRKTDSFDKKIKNEKLKEINNFFMKRKYNRMAVTKLIHQRICSLLSRFEKYKLPYGEVFIYQDYKPNSSDMKSLYSVPGTFKGNSVAIKVINENFLQSGGEEELERLRKEIEYLTRLDYKYIAKFVGYTINPKDNSYWIVTELKGEASLFWKLLMDKNLYDNTVKTKIAYKIALAMNYIRSQGILRLNLNSSNIIIEGKTRPKLVDLGNSIIIDSYESDAPQKTNSDNVDVYSFGILLSEMLKEQPYKMVKNDIQDLINSKNEVLSPLERLIKKCLGDQRLDFVQILSDMKTYYISFPDADEKAIKNFYDKKKT